MTDRKPFLRLKLSEFTLTLLRDCRAYSGESIEHVIQRVVGNYQVYEFGRITVAANTWRYIDMQKLPGEKDQDALNRVLKKAIAALPPKYRRARA